MRQIHVEGWTEAHDDEHTGGEMALAAACYAMDAACPADWADPAEGETPAFWPWPECWWKPTAFQGDRIKQLVKAGALIAAEIDRIKRARAREAQERRDRKANG
jgi:hypothetical protein